MYKKVKVLQICSYYLGTKLYQNLFDSIQKLDVDEDVYVYVDNEYKINEKFPDNIYVSKCYNKFNRYIFYLKHNKVLYDIKDKMPISKYNILHAHSLFSNGYISYKLNKEYNIPYIVAVRNTDVNLFFEKIKYTRHLGINILRNAKKIIFISESYRKIVLNKYVPEKYIEDIAEKSLVIPNGIDKFWLDNKYNEKKEFLDNKITLIYAGRIDSNKNIETTIKACKILIDQGYEINYKIIGKIFDKKYNDLMECNSFIEYIPHCQMKDLINYYRESDIFVMPSRYETFGLVYAEAMSQGLPVIYTRGQGFDSQFEEGAVGYSVEYNSSEEIASRIKEIIYNYEMISNNCTQEVKRFDWDKIAELYFDTYRIREDD